MYISYGCLFNRLSSCRRNLLFVTILTSLFLKIGKAIYLGFYIDHSMLFGISFIFLTLVMLYLKKIKLSVNRKMLFFCIAYFVVVFIGEFFLLVDSSGMPKILSDRTPDAYVMGLSSTWVTPAFSIQNVKEIVFNIYFFFIIFLSMDLLKEKIFMYSLVIYIKRGFYVYFVLFLLEMLSNIYFGETVFREIVMYLLWGDADDSVASIMERFGVLIPMVFFHETSFVCVCIILLLLYYVNKFDSQLDVIMFFVMLFVLISSMSTMGWGLILFWLVVYVKNYQSKYKKIYLLITLSYMALGVIYCIENLDVVTAGIDFAQVKLETYLGIDKVSVNMSGEARGLSNKIAMDEIKYSPIWGIGLGSMYSFGMIPSFFSNVGILGAFLFCYVVGLSINCKISRSNFVPFIIMMFYLTSIFNGHMYIYQPMGLTLFLPYSQSIFYKK